jgi:hypothetical protein
VASLGLESPLSYPCDRFAAALAHYLNSDGAPTVRIEPGALYVRLIGLLAARYADSLLKHPWYASRMDAEEAAGRYFDATLGRKLLLTGRVPLSVAHRLFAALCARHDGAIKGSTLRRRTGGVPAANDIGVLRAIRARLTKLSPDVSPGSASATLLARLGPIVLSAGANEAWVPEEMAIWDSIVCSPSPLSALPPGEPFNRFCSIVIDCLRTANRPVLELLSLGRPLCPFDWLGELSIQQVRALKRLLRHLGSQGVPDTLENWRAALAQHPVPGFKEAEELWRSPIGTALRNGGIHPSVGLDHAAELSEAEDSIELFLNLQEYRDQVRLLYADNVINAEERDLLIDVYAGVALEELAERAPIRVLLHARHLSIEQLIEDLRERAERWQQGAA